ncbi:MAG: peptide chain release factor 1 [Candidatus Azobacteroides pseudotrichonymphae]|jgi:peptide chain release factor 1|uniref:Peptide chain release factor 1 n=2 Tax=Candidatus Azobacteroides TaxID=511434 RepID=B6YRE2_AZOPC|nr:peptide chain release factor 1 [Candidatus Azobacteroides pseudotrichonymphae genomovar. CFP2]GMO35182.1 MAG: peptide chain release factor 1 [Candidatus Azobacteroides pseudotrichonymphae]
MTSLLEKLDILIIRFEEIGKLISNPDSITDMKRFVKLNKEYRELEKISLIRDQYKQTLINIIDAQTILEKESDKILREIAKEELEESTSLLNQLEKKIKLLLIPIDPQDGKNAIVEIRSGTGGDEASLFAGDLYKMYSKYCESKGWKIAVTSSSEGTIGGFKEIIFTVNGENVYSTLKYESGVHRVQRVPITETQGRIHTSAATVAVFPEAKDVDIEIKESDIRTDTFCSSGPGGQSVNTTYSAIRLTHIPTGIVVQCQDERSQLKNKEKAMTELRSRIYNIEYQKQIDETALKRKTMVSTGDRSAKIRTYNYPQGRVTDHRINYTTYNLLTFLEGNIQEFINQLIIAENSEKLKDSEL